jgi:hypothetical protein
LYRVFDSADMSTDEISDCLPTDKRFASVAVHVIANDHRDMRCEVIFADPNANGVEPLQLTHEELRTSFTDCHQRTSRTLRRAGSSLADGNPRPLAAVTC